MECQPSTCRSLGFPLTMPGCSRWRTGTSGSLVASCHRRERAERCLETSCHASGGGNDGTHHAPVASCSGILRSSGAPRIQRSGDCCQCILGPFALYARMARDPNWRSLAPATLVLPGMAWLFAEVSGVGVSGALRQRLWLLLMFIWIEVVAVRLFRLETGRVELGVS